MLLQIRYSADYHYEEKVSLSPHTLRIFPRQDHFLRLLSRNLLVPPDADCHFRRDLFGNDTATLFFPCATDLLSIQLETVIETPAINPFHFLLENRALQLPIEYEPLEKQILAPYLAPQFPLSNLPPLISKQQSPSPFLLDTSSWLHDTIAYEARQDGDPLPPEETLRLRRGACRDFAVLFAEILRAKGLAARLTSGYLWEGDSDDSSRVADGAFHAWVETYLPGAGWIGVDPTNAVLCDHHSIPAASGLSHLHIAPVTGSYFGKKIVPSHLETRLSVTCLPE